MKIGWEHRDNDVTRLNRRGQLGPIKFARICRNVFQDGLGFGQGPVPKNEGSVGCSESTDAGSGGESGAKPMYSGHRNNWD
jgi:hypothetical protein